MVLEVCKEKKKNLVFFSILEFANQNEIGSILISVGSEKNVIAIVSVNYVESKSSVANGRCCIRSTL